MNCSFSFIMKEANAASYGSTDGNFFPRRAPAFIWFFYFFCCILWWSGCFIPASAGKSPTDGEEFLRLDATLSSDNFEGASRANLDKASKGTFENMFFGLHTSNSRSVPARSLHTDFLDSSEDEKVENDTDSAESFNYRALNGIFGWKSGFEISSSLGDLTPGLWNVLFPSSQRDTYDYLVTALEDNLYSVFEQLKILELEGGTLLTTINVLEEFTCIAKLLHGLMDDSILQMNDLPAKRHLLSYLNIMTHLVDAVSNEIRNLEMVLYTNCVNLMESQELYPCEYVILDKLEVAIQELARYVYSESESSANFFAENEKVIAQPLISFSSEELKAQFDAHSSREQLYFYKLDSSGNLYKYSQSVYSKTRRLSGSPVTPKYEQLLDAKPSVSEKPINNLNRVHSTGAGISKNGAAKNKSLFPTNLKFLPGSSHSEVEIPTQIIAPSSSFSEKSDSEGAARSTATPLPWLREFANAPQPPHTHKQVGATKIFSTNQQHENASKTIEYMNGATSEYANKANFATKFPSFNRRSLLGCKESDLYEYLGDLYLITNTTTQHLSSLPITDVQELMRYLNDYVNQVAWMAPPQLNQYFTAISNISQNSMDNVKLAATALEAKKSGSGLSSLASLDNASIMFYKAFNIAELTQLRDWFEEIYRSVEHLSVFEYFQNTANEMRSLLKDVLDTSKL